MKIAETFLDIIFPKKCLCGKYDTFLCENCYQKIEKAKTQLCPICKKISAFGRTCPTCRYRTDLTGVMILGEHRGSLKELIWRYKYNLIRELARPLGRMLNERFGAYLSEKKFLITFVPISKKRFHWRGFNQSELLAKELAKLTGLKVETLLYRKKGKSQVGLNRKERIKNLKEQIQLVRATKKSGRVLIVDDVYTSGATLEECAKKLRESGFREVWGIVLSRD